jgi:hypothetical protein
VLNRLNTCVLAGLPYLMKQKEQRFAEFISFKILMHKKLLLYIIYVQACCPYEPIFFSFPIPLLCVLHLPGAICLIVVFTWILIQKFLENNWKWGMAVLLLENTRRWTEMLSGKFNYVWPCSTFFMIIWIICYLYMNPERSL